MGDVVRYGSPAGFAAAAAEANRRRQSSARAAVAAVAAVAVLGGTLGPADRGASTGLVPTSPGGAATAEPRHPQRRPSSPPREPREARDARGVVPGGDGGGVRNAPVAAPPELAAPPAAPAGRATRAPGAAPAAPRTPRSRPLTTTQEVAGVCGIEAGRDAWQPCAMASGPFSGKNFLTLSVKYCSTARDTVLRFTEDIEVEFRIKGPEGVGPWTSLRDHPPAAAPHERPVRAGHCISWSQDWFKRTNDGAAVPPGRYALRLLIRSDDAPTLPLLRFQIRE